MDSDSTERCRRLLGRFASQGFSAVVDDELRDLGAFLREEALATGRASSTLLSEAIIQADLFFREHDEYGGVQVDFVGQLDRIARERVPAILHAADAPAATGLAFAFREELTERLRNYSPTDKYDPAE